MSKFKVGDKVKIILNFNKGIGVEYNGVYFANEMVKYVHNILIVEEIIAAYPDVIYSNGWEWHEDWLELVEESEDCECDESMNKPCENEIPSLDYKNEYHRLIKELSDKDLIIVSLLDYIRNNL